MCVKDGMAGNQKQQICVGSTYHVRAVPQGSAIMRQKNMLEDMIGQFENQMQHHKYWTYTEARNETPTNYIKDSTQQNNRPDTISDCTVNPHTTIAVTSNAENGASSESPKICELQAKCKNR